MQCMMQGTPWQRLARAIRWVARLPEIKAIMRFMQILSSMLFVVLYVWGTYSTPRPFSWRFNLDIALCALFATEWLWRLVVSQYTSNSTCPFPCIKACVCCFTAPNHETTAKTSTLMLASWQVCDKCLAAPPCRIDARVVCSKARV